MTNNINGIDVSDCRFYEPKAQKMTCHEEAITKPCESTPICYYKLLQKSYIEIQRLQEENESLKSLNDFNVQKIEVLQEEIEKLYKALENIREAILKNYTIDGEDIVNIINEVLNDRD